jgi:hypothetical protein
MIQDMQNPELYLEQYEVRDSISEQRTVKRGKYRDIPVCGVSNLLTRLLERGKSVTGC